jgi:hypothetical protein
MSRWRSALVVLTFAFATSTAPASVCPTSEQGFRRLASPDAEVAFRWEPAELKIGQFFAAEVVTCGTRGQEPVREITIDATMPAHGHGMNYRPAATRTAPGHYRFTGLMLHMPGTWRVTIDLHQGGKRSRLTHEVILRP